LSARPSQGRYADTSRNKRNAEKIVGRIFPQFVGNSRGIFLRFTWLLSGLPA
jgi:hypothetical protein